VAGKRLEKAEKALVYAEHTDFITTWALRIFNLLISIGLGKLFQYLLQKWGALASDLKIAAWIIISAMLFGVGSLIIARLRKIKAQQEGPSPETEGHSSALTSTAVVELTPSHGASTKQLLAVKNMGKKQKFYAQCRLVARRNDDNILHTKSYDLAWERDLSREIALATGESCNLQIATASHDHASDLGEAKLLGLSNGSLEIEEFSRWYESDRRPRPETDFEISVFGEEYGSVTEMFTLKCGGKSVALEMVRVRDTPALPVTSMPELVIEYVYSEQKKTPMGSDYYGQDRPLIVRNVSEGKNAFNVRLLPLITPGGTATFQPEIVTCINGKGSAEFIAKIENGPLLMKNQFVPLLGRCYKDSGDLQNSELFKHKSFLLKIVYQDSTHNEYEATCEITYRHWKTEVNTGNVTYKRIS
jgi:hypothetical protein